MESKSSRQKWKEEDMKAAIDAVRTKKMGWKLATKSYGVPKSTLRRRVLDKNKVIRGAQKGFLGGATTVFDPEVESELVEHVKRMADRFFGLTVSDVRRLAFELAEKMGLRHNFNKDKSMAGWDWYNNFMKRNPSLSLRSPEATSMARAEGFNEVQVRKFFEAFKKVIDENGLQPEQIFNMDESGFSTVQNRTEKILAQRGRKQVGTLTSAERGHHFTVVCCMSAVGHFIPPAMIFPRKNMKKELIDQAPTGTIGLVQENGWMNSELCLKWMQHFKRYTTPSKEKKILLLLDGHSSHKNLEVLTFAKDNNIILFCFPAHCTHRLQPLDVSFFAPLTTYYNQAVKRWLTAHPGRIVTHYQVGELFNEAYIKAATVGIAASGFRATGLVPFNDAVFPEWMFSPSKTTDIPDSNDNKNTDRTIDHDSESSSSNAVPSTSNQNKKKSPPPKNESNVKLVTIIEEISPLPQLEKKSSRRRTNRGKLGILNTTPDIAAGKEKAREKREKEERIAAKKAKRNLRPVDEEEPENEELFEADDDDVNDAACIFCNDLYSRSRKGDFWIQCQKCLSWCHTDCAGVDKKTKMYICDLC